jgi:hypothetical protein
MLRAEPVTQYSYCPPLLRFEVFGHYLLSIRPDLGNVHC